MLFRSVSQSRYCRFQDLFHSPPGVLFAFPSRYWCAIDRLRVFSLGGWAPHIQTGFLVPRPTLELTRVEKDFAYGAITLYRWPSQAIQLSFSYLMLWSVTPTLRLVWAVPLSLAATYGIDFLSFPLGTKMFQFPRSFFSISHCFLIG